MSTLSRRFTIDAPVEKVFDLALDVGRFWPCSPEVAVRDVVLTPDRVGTKASIWTHGLGVHFEGHIETPRLSAPSGSSPKWRSGPEKPMWVFTFEPADAGTKMTGQGEWHVKAPAVGKTLEAWMAKSQEGFLETLLANFKAMAEAPAD